tara:strand:- start:1669 stop:2307 length:639 start_codon:yes stop_codon:yes gene_type:complete
MITKGKLTDQILRLYSGGSANDEKEISRDDINLLVGQTINRLLKTEHLSVNMQSGELYPPHTLITTYFVDLSSNSSNNPYVHAFLPVFPISLPRNIGVWSVSSPGCQDEYIPLQTGQQSLISSQDQLVFLETQVGYWVEGNVINFLTDITESPYNESKVRIQLLIVDPTIQGEYDYLQIPVEMEDAVVKEVLTLIGALPKVVDKVSDSNSQI